ncbi:MAG: DMT family transporter, partial [Chloroflexota bacterium]
TAFLWSSSGLFIKLISWGPFAILSGRSLIATFIVLLYLKRPAYRFTWLEVVGALGYMGTQIFFIMGTKLTVAANIIFLSFTSPLYLILFGYWFLKERPQRADWLAIPAIFLGMILFFGDDFSFDGIRGNIYGVLAGMSMAVMVMCMRHQKDQVPARIVFLGNIISVLVGLPALLTASFNLPDVGIILYLGIFQIGLSFVLYSWAIQHLQALEATLIVTLEPVLNPIWVFLVIGEIPGSLAFVGGALVLGAVIIRAIASARATDQQVI